MTIDNLMDLCRIVNAEMILLEHDWQRVQCISELSEDICQHCGSVQVNSNCMCTKAEKKD